MSGIVVDASAILSWCFEDERPKNADAILKQMQSEGMAAPTHWPLEVVNILGNAEKRGRISAADASAFVSLVEALGVEIDLQTPKRSWTEIRSISHAERLTSYDAAYLELAMRRRMKLATKDADLIEAARRRGVKVIDLSV